ncbi:hypothetical protein EPO15_09700 [bacterium]|nr:MAG: hypothetical protein EPO15_09700 [bacterium]
MRRLLAAALAASLGPSPACAQLARAAAALRAPVPVSPFRLPTPSLTTLTPNALTLPSPASGRGGVEAKVAVVMPASLPLPLAGEGGVRVAVLAAPDSVANPAAEERREEPSAREQLSSIAADADPDRLWTGAVPAAQAQAQLSRAHRETFKFFFGSRVGLLRDMIRQQEAETAGRARSVKDLTGMWVAWRTKGYTGRTQTAGFETADRGTVRAEAVKVYDRYFPKDAEARAAFHRFLDRVDAYVPLRRPSNYRKLAFGVFYEAPTLPPEALKAKIDSSLSEAHLTDIARWRAERQDAVTASFKAAALASIREMNRVLPEGKKIVALILLGSYAIGQSTPNSDVDFQLVTQDGSPDAIAPFKEALVRNWTENKLDKLEAFQFALPPSPEVVRESFPEGYQVISPDPRAVRELTFDTAPRAPTAWTRVRGKAFEWGYTAWIRAWFLGASLKEALVKR